jgi:hypothetical protein
VLCSRLLLGFAIINWINPLRGYLVTWKKGTRLLVSSFSLLVLVDQTQVLDKLPWKYLQPWLVLTLTKVDPLVWKPSFKELS